MSTEKYYVTAEGLEELKSELNNLIHNTRAEVIQELQEARAQGDLSENADYDAAREKQAQVEARIKELEGMIKNAVLFDEATQAQSGKAAYVRLGAKVKIRDLSDNEEAVYSIVGTVEANPFEGKISNDSPFAKAIMDKQAGERVMIKAVEEPYEVEILEVLA